MRTLPRVPRRVVAAALTALIPLTTAACARSDGSTAGPPSDPVLRRHNLEGMTARQLIERLDQTNDDRNGGPAVSVRSDQLQVSDTQGRTTLPIPGEEFYLSVAPFLTRTHECYYHNLQTCQGELRNTPVTLKITDTSGKVLVQQDAVTYPNGFVAAWVPKNVKGTVEITAQGRRGTAPFSSDREGPTCLTTLQLTEPTAP